MVKKFIDLLMEDEYEVHHLRSCRVVNGTREYLVHWKGYSKESDTWEREGDLNCDDLLEMFWRKSRKRVDRIRKICIIGRYVQNGEIVYEAQFNNNISQIVSERFLSKYYPKELIDYVLNA